MTHEYKHQLQNSHSFSILYCKLRKWLVVNPFDFYCISTKKKDKGKKPNFLGSNWLIKLEFTLLAFDRLWGDNVFDFGIGAMAAAIRTHINESTLYLYRTETHRKKCFKHKSFGNSKFASHFSKVYYLYIFFSYKFTFTFSFDIWAPITRRKSISHWHFTVFQVQTHHIHFRGALYLWLFCFEYSMRLTPSVQNDAVVQWYPNKWAHEWTTYI